MNKKAKSKKLANKTSSQEPTNQRESTNPTDPAFPAESKQSTEQTAPNPQRNHKDTIFRMLFKEEKNMLSLYNALNETTYTDVSGLEVTTLENAVYMTYKNDVSFIFDHELMLYEHQSTQNPNLPLRDLIYVTAVLKGLIKNKEKLYSSKLFQIPAPRFVVFYNGEGGLPEKDILKLSNAYQKHQEQPELELIVTVYNINYGHNPRLLEACQLLNEYSHFVSIVRDYTKGCKTKASTKEEREKALKEAIEKAIDYCIKNDILADFLLKNKAEATDMCIYEFDEEKYMDIERDHAYQDGLEQGLKQGEALLSTLMQHLLADGRIEDAKLAATDEHARNKFYKEYNLNLTIKPDPADITS